MIRTDIKLKYGYTQDDIKDAIITVLPVSRDEIGEYKIVKRELNIKDKSNIHYDATIGISFSEERELGLLKMRKKVSPLEDYSFALPSSRLNLRPVVIGAGPAGLFAALALAEAGARPILFERGLSVEDRKKKVDLFTSMGILDTECNVQFGEGGAGTYSDGKLKVGGMDKYKLKVLSEFVSAGAPEDIIYSVGAHLGTDKLSEIIKKIRKKIISLGAEVNFGAKLLSLRIKDGKVCGGVVEQNREIIEFEAENIVMATGHSAEDSFRILSDSGAILEPKGFGIGVRIEHPREHIDRLIYGEKPPSEIGSASYHLVTHLENGRNVYSFCMCPGGSVVSAASEEGGIVTNGMSEFARNADNSNAAFLVSVTPNDFPDGSPLGGVALQREIERLAFKAAGNNYKAPVTVMGDFVSGDRQPKLSSVTPSYMNGVTPMPMSEYMPGYVTESLRKAIFEFEDWLPGFYYHDAAITGPETRTTSPIRVLRNDDFSATGVLGLYPCGEGAGYAGGIVSSARDGLMVAEKILQKQGK